MQLRELSPSQQNSIGLIPALSIFLISIVLDAMGIGVSRSQVYDYLRMSEGEADVTVDSVNRLPEPKWKRLGEREILRGESTADVIWARVKIPKSSKPKTVVIGLWQNTVSSADFYLAPSGESAAKLVLSSHDANSWGSAVHPIYRVETSSDHDAYLYAKIRPWRLSKVRFFVASEYEYTAQLTSRTLLSGGILGGIFVLILFGSGLYLVLRNFTFAYFILMQLLIFGAYLFASGDIFRFWSTLTTNSNLRMFMLDIQIGLAAFIGIIVWDIHAPKAVRTVSKIKAVRLFGALIFAAILAMPWLDENLGFIAIPIVIGVVCAFLINHQIRYFRRELFGVWGVTGAAFLLGALIMALGWTGHMNDSIY